MGSTDYTAEATQRPSPGSLHQPRSKTAGIALIAISLAFSAALLIFALLQKWNDRRQVKRAGAAAAARPKMPKSPMPSEYMMTSKSRPESEAFTTQTDVELHNLGNQASSTTLIPNSDDPPWVQEHKRTRTSMHAQGVQLWGGANWSRQKRFMHPGVNLVDFSPDERYLTTWSHRPLQVEEGNPVLSLEEDGKNYVIWDISTGKPLRSFVTLDLPGPTQDAEGNPIKKKMQWPAFKWSADSKYVARMTQGQSISVYELPRMNLMDKQSIKID